MSKAIRALIHRLESVGTLSAAARDVIAALPLTERSHLKGEEIVADGEVSTHCCLVVSGYVYRSKLLPSGSRQIFSLHMLGDIPDLHSLHLPKMDHNLAAMSDSRVAYIAHSEINKALEQAPELIGLFWRTTLIDSAAFRAWLLMLGQADASTRMAHLFCEMFTRAAMAGLAEGSSFPLPLTQNDLADYLGISLVHANRTLQDLRSSGVLEFQHQTATILRWNELRAMGQFDPAYLHYLDPAIGRMNPSALHVEP